MTGQPICGQGPGERDRDRVPVRLGDRGDPDRAAVPRSAGSRPSVCSLRRKYGSRSAYPQPAAPPAAQPS